MEKFEIWSGWPNIKFSGWMDGIVIVIVVVIGWVSIGWGLGEDLLAESQTISLDLWKPYGTRENHRLNLPPPLSTLLPPLPITNVWTLLLCLSAVDRLQTKVISLSRETRGLKELIGKFKHLIRSEKNCRHRHNEKYLSCRKQKSNYGKQDCWKMLCCISLSFLWSFVFVLV